MLRLGRKNLCDLPVLEKNSIKFVYSFFEIGTMVNSSRLEFPLYQCGYKGTCHLCHKSQNNDPEDIA